MHKLLFIFLLSVEVLLAQQKEYRGTVYDQFDNRIIGAKVINLNTKDSTKTDCEGKFRILMNKADSISIVKENYLTYSKKIGTRKRMHVTLNFDVFKIRRKLSAYKDEDKRNNPNYKPNCCQPLFILDGEPYHRSKNWDHLKTKDLKDVQVFKGADAINMFSDFAKSGVIFVSTRCKSD